MRFYTSTRPKIKNESSVALGCFDGVHVGHSEIISSAVNAAKKNGLTSIVWSFQTPPKSILSENFNSSYLLTSLTEKKKLMRELQVDILICVPFNEKIAKLSPRDFFKNIIVNRLNAKQIFCGFNYRFGYMGEGDVKLLQSLCDEFGISLTVLKEITVDGINTKNISTKDLHGAIAIVSQETYLFRGTILENIRYAKPDATDEEVINAAKAAYAHKFIMAYPDGYETMVGFGHKDLSGGERQRISIARAILTNPKILILDEATAAMDTQTEHQIQKALDKVTENRTTIIIAHRLSTLKNADKIIVIEDGKIAEQGKPAKLLSEKGVYHRLYTLQAEAFRTIGIGE